MLNYNADLSSGFCIRLDSTIQYYGILYYASLYCTHVALDFSVPQIPKAPEDVASPVCGYLCFGFLEA